MATPSSTPPVAKRVLLKPQRPLCCLVHALLPAELLLPPCVEMADVATDPEIKRQLLTFVIVGAGFSGVETVAEVNELIRRALKYYPNIDKREIRVMLVEYASRILPTFSADLAAYATRTGKDQVSRLGTSSPIHRWSLTR